MVLTISAAIAAGGAAALRHAAAIPDHVVPAHRVVGGRVVEVLTLVCGTGNRTRPCYRPVVDYVVDGRPGQVVARTASNPSPSRKGDAADVVVLAGGDAWIADEWRSRQAQSQRDADDARRFPRLMGWILVGCATLGGLLAVGVLRAT
jgi:hypothetical protein